jgi:arylsulfatase
MFMMLDGASTSESCKYDGLGFATLAFNNLSGIGRGGTGVLRVDGRPVATQAMERTLPLILQWDESRVRLSAG